MGIIRKVKDLCSKEKRQLNNMLKIEGDVIVNSDERTELISNIKNSKSGDKVIRKSNYITKNYGQLK